MNGTNSGNVYEATGVCMCSEELGFVLPVYQHMFFYAEFRAVEVCMCNEELGFVFSCLSAFLLLCEVLKQMESVVAEGMYDSGEFTSVGPNPRFEPVYHHPPFLPFEEAKRVLLRAQFQWYKIISV